MSSSPSLPYKDRSTWLIVFGIFNIILGGMCALLVPFMFFCFSVAPKATMQPLGSHPAIVICACYGLPAVGLIWLGIGSILARRWARAILLIFSWFGLVTGVFTAIIFAISMPATMQNMPSHSETPGMGVAGIIGMVIAGSMLLFFLVVIPAIWVFFYKSPSVKATCEARNPAPCWTDACPLPVLLVSLGLAIGTPMMLAMPFLMPGILPFFGTFLIGPPATAAFVILAFVWGYGAWATYKLDRRFWGILLVLMLLMTASNVVTYGFHSVTDLYRLMKIPADQIALFETSSFLRGRNMMWMSLLMSLPMLGYLVYIGRYFKKAGPGLSEPHR